MNSNLPAVQAGGKAVLLTGPFGAPERTIHLSRPMTIAEVIALHGLRFRLPTIAVLDGAPVLRGAWNVRMVRAEDVIGFVAMPAGGGNASGKQVIGLVAALALSIAAPMVGHWAAASFFAGSSIASSLVSGLVLAGGAFLLNTLFPPPAEVPNDSGDQVYIANAASNQAAPFDVVPVLYGREKFAPRLASRPYSEYSGNDQFLYQLFAVTLGKADIERIDIGETEAWRAEGGLTDSFSDLEIEIVHPGEDVTLFPANVVTAPEVGSQVLPDPPDQLGPFVVNAAGTTINRIALDFSFPLGLFDPKSEGGTRAANRGLVAQYRRIDDSGAPIGGWSNLINETITRNTRTPQRMSRSASVPEGRYEVTFRATNRDTSGEEDGGTAGAPYNRVQWEGLRGYLTGFVTPPNCTLLAVKIRANEQLSQVSANQLKVTAARYLDVWNSGAGQWVEQKTSSIAWAAADILRNSDYSIGLADTQYDLAWLMAKHQLWAGRGDEFNALFDRSWTISDALRAVLRAGRAQPVRVGGKVGFTRLEPKQVKRAVFTPRNVIRGSFSHELVLFDEEKPDSVIGEYRDRTIWDTREVRAGLASIGSDAPQRIDYFGMTDHDHVWREAVTDAAVNAYQREFVGFTSEWEGKLLVRGDPILVHHPFIEQAATVSLVGIAGQNLTIDRDYSGDDWDDGGSWSDFDTWTSEEQDRYVIVRDKRGEEWGPCRVASINGRVLTLDAADRAVVEAQMGTLASLLPGDRSERAHVIICTGETRPFNGLVVSAIPNGSDRVDVLAVIDAPEVYMADGEEVMPSPWTPPTLPPAVPLRPIILGLVAELRASGAGLEIEAMWRPSVGATSYVAEVSYDGEESWIPVYEGSNNRFNATVLPQVLTLRVAPLGRVQGPWVIREFIEGEVPDIRIPGGWLDLDGVAEQVRDSVSEMSDWERHNTRETIESIREAFLEDGASSANAYLDRQKIRQEIISTTGANRAAWSLDILAATGPDSAIVARIEELRAEVFDPNTGLPATASALSLLSSQVNNPATGLVAASNAITSLVSSVPGASAEGLLRIFTEASASGEDVRIALSAATSGSVGPASAAMYVTAGGGNSEILMVANRIAFITSPTGTKRGLLVVDGDNVFIDTARIRNLSVANMSADFIDALDISAESILSQNANITGTLHVGTGSTGVFIQGPNNRILIVD